MTLCINYQDTITIIKPRIDGYNTETIGESAEVKSLFIANTGYSHGANADQIDSNASAYIDFNNEFVKNNFNRLEGMLVIANPFGGPSSEAWYRITSVNIGQDKLLCNKIDNVTITLKKSTPISYVS